MRINSTSIASLYFIMDNLSRGINPCDGVQFPYDTTLKSKVLQSAFSESAKIFKALMVSATENDDIIIFNTPTGRKAPFYLLKQELESITTFEDEITISRFTFYINESVHRKGMKKLRATQLTSWLAQHNYLELTELKNAVTCKVSTELGKSIGIHTIYKTNAADNTYVTNTYTKSAQEFLVHTVLPQIVKIIDIKPT